MVKKRLFYRETFREYLNDGVKLELYQKIGILFLVVVFAGFAGWLWEFSLQEVGGRFQHLYIKGGNLLPCVCGGGNCVRILRIICWMGCVRSGTWN